MPASFPETAISTERLLLRPLEEGDAPGLVAMMADELVLSWTDVPQPYTRAHALGWLRSEVPELRAAGRGIAFAITEHLTQRLVGIVELHHTDWRLLSTEASYVTAPWARGEGYAVESLLGVAQWLFEDRGFHRLELRTAAGNTAAQQVAQKIGCISEGVLRSAWIVRTGEVGSAGEETRSDLILWSLLPEDLEAFDSYDGYHASQQRSGNFALHD
ncbi:RimJ/RimL family protein N-acetyltransferase [Kitasatospora sp. MAA4]|uniref:GNAT family N-acetyltransferase n=1 Tax=Kitasatospora sp. MAA4 TaxID=3035093 RepID=UPI00247510ED|nr:GNAT family N-acetyltransferase [Kitasatospora sp. MAA4]MDH6133669.1 RimJ/RimL family protein N-acetyltransferase [Kitasatospora sp. MAA4]